MDWHTLINTDRGRDHGKEEDPLRRNFVQDADRITFSAPFRRLANKTQVHPLYEHDHLRHRMIHSVEVASVGRTLGMKVGHWLEGQGHLAPGEASKVAGIVHAACLAHDIGNPPFGHSGEEAMGGWIEEQFQAKRALFDDIPEDKRVEFTPLEGNAQGFRIITRLEMYRNQGGMNLSHAVLGAFTKYPMTASTSKALCEANGGKAPYVGAKKFGVFQSEFDYLQTAARALGLPEETAPDGSAWWRRHPLVFLVEAADDICYNIVDLEDGFSSGDLNLKQVEDLLDPIAIPTNRDITSYSDYERVSYLRARSIGGAINACVEAFIDHHTAILAGQFSDELIAVSNKSEAFAAIKDCARNRLFTAPRKTKLEIQGRNSIRRVLQGVWPVYEALAAAQWTRDNLPAYETQLARAFALDLRDVTDAYSALHSLTDFVSGMTDRYAVKTAELL
ncbi:dGTP triphosphohydrolase [Falsiruegeria mediterranea]|uniref:Deoxyguanosinetriphosphate triphosphohydrolase n=1 Tax=Falsiruegeria mediterranea M17 TaxID=1200281 RepID=A0A2R8C2A5_9RHOB|nr:dNTP triphosphohydrolase [Falsiruegeria mediterranea]SPJ26565.1 Deoxyguanosinetriphosphate triphosphohydrolase [Falsiruegeria mediterranea M17]